MIICWIARILEGKQKYLKRSWKLFRKTLNSSAPLARIEKATDTNENKSNSNKKYKMRQEQVGNIIWTVQKCLKDLSRIKAKKKMAETQFKSPQKYSTEDILFHN